MTPDVKATTRNRSTVHSAIEALTAAEMYVRRLMPQLLGVSELFREGDDARAREELACAVAGIGFLANLMAAVGNATGIESTPSSDHQLGCIALALQELRLAEQRQDVPALVAIIEEELLPAISRLAPTFTQLEARVAAFA